MAKHTFHGDREAYDTALENTTRALARRCAEACIRALGAVETGRALELFTDAIERVLKANR